MRHQIRVNVFHFQNKINQNYWTEIQTERFYKAQSIICKCQMKQCDKVISIIRRCSMSQFGFAWLACRFWSTRSVDVSFHDKAQTIVSVDTGPWLMWEFARHLSPGACQRCDRPAGGLFRCCHRRDLQAKQAARTTLTLGRLHTERETRRSHNDGRFSAATMQINSRADLYQLIITPVTWKRNLIGPDVVLLGQIYGSQFIVQKLRKLLFFSWGWFRNWGKSGLL